MTRPAILDLDMAVTPRKSVPLPYDLQDDFCEDPECEHGCAEMRQERDEFNRKHNGPDPAWDDVRKYVEGLEAGHKAVSDFVRVRIPYDQNKDQADCYLAHIGLICRLEERAEVAEARIAELEKRLADAERVIKPFAEAVSKADAMADRMGFARSFDEYAPEWTFTFGNLRAARSYMEGK